MKEDNRQLRNRLAHLMAERGANLAVDSIPIAEKAGHDPGAANSGSRGEVPRAARSPIHAAASLHVQPSDVRLSSDSESTGVPTARDSEGSPRGLHPGSLNLAHAQAAAQPLAGVPAGTHSFPATRTAVSETVTANSAGSGSMSGGYRTSLTANTSTSSHGRADHDADVSGHQRPEGSAPVAVMGDLRLQAKEGGDGSMRDVDVFISSNSSLISSRGAVEMQVHHQWDQHVQQQQNPNAQGLQQQWHWGW